MTVRLEFEPEIEEAARAAAQVRGMSLEEYLLMLLEETLVLRKRPTDQEIAEFEADLDALIHGDEKAASQPNEMFQRAHIFGED